jgi:hypothetical protein
MLVTSCLHILRIGITALASKGLYTLCGTSRCGRYDTIIIGVAKCCDFFLCYQNGITYGAVLSLGLTCGGTGGGYGLVDDLRVPLGIYVVVLIGVGATRASIGGVTLCGTGGSSDLFGIAMPQSCYSFLLDEDSITDRTMLTFGLSGGGTGCRNRLVDNLGVSLGIYVVVLIAVGATRASIGGVALCGTGGCSDLGAVAVPQSFGSCGEGESTVGGGIPLVAVCSCFGTGGSFCGGLGIVSSVELG